MVARVERVRRTPATNACDARASQDTQIASSYLTSLPNELLLDVTERIQGDNQALAGLMRSCKRLKLAAEGFLYTIITIPSKPKHKAPHLVRTLLETPVYALKVSELNLAIDVSYSSLFDEMDSADMIDIASQPMWITNVLKHLTNLNNGRVALWMYKALSGFASSIAIMLLTLPHVADVRLLVNQGAIFVEPVRGISMVLFGIDDISEDPIQSVLRSPLSTVKRLRLSSGNMRLLDLPCDSVELLELDLGVEEVSVSPQFPSTRSNTFELLDLPAYSRLRTLVLHSDWSELLPIPGQASILPLLLRMIRGPWLRRVEFYMKWSPRKASTENCSFSYLLHNLGGRKSKLEELKVDYLIGPGFNPRACLGDFFRTLSLEMFPRLKDLIILQEGIISCNYRRSIDFEWDFGLFFPSQLETLTIICPTIVVLQWLDRFQEQLSFGTVASFREVTLLCRCGHGGSPDDFKSDIADQCFSALIDVGILVKVVEEIPGAFANLARKEESVWEADWAEHSWAEAMFGVDG